MKARGKHALADVNCYSKIMSVVRWYNIVFMLKMLQIHINVCDTVQLLVWFLQCNGRKLEEAEDFKSVFIVYCTRVIWKVLSMVFYLSDQFTNPVMFGIILKSYLSSLLYHNFHEAVMMQTRKILLWIHFLFVYWKTQNFSGRYNFLPLEKCAKH